MSVNRGRFRTFGRWGARADEGEIVRIIEISEVAPASHSNLRLVETAEVAPTCHNGLKLVESTEVAPTCH